MKIKILIAEDEPVARRRIKRLLSNDEELEIVGEAADGQTAVRLLREMKPDLLFLDIQMPELNGFEVLKMLTEEPLPEIIFTTAFDNYALEAFDAHALDYLLKPFERERFERALNRAKQYIRRKPTGDANQQLASLIQSLKPKSNFAERLVVKKAEEIFLLKTAEIDWIEAAGDYLRLHVGKQVHLLRETMGAMESKLDPARFLRIGRSAIVNVERIKKLSPLFRGSYVVFLEDGTQLTSSRSHRERLQKLFGESL